MYLSFSPVPGYSSAKLFSKVKKKNDPFPFVLLIRNLSPFLGVHGSRESNLRALSFKQFVSLMCTFSDHPFAAIAARYFFETVDRIIQNLAMEAAAAPNALLRVKKTLPRLFSKKLITLAFC